MFVCVYTCVYICIYTCVCMCIHMYVCVYTYIYIYIRIYDYYFNVGHASQESLQKVGLWFQCCKLSVWFVACLYVCCLRGVVLLLLVCLFKTSTMTSLLSRLLAHVRHSVSLIGTVWLIVLVLVVYTSALYIYIYICIYIYMYYSIISLSINTYTYMYTYMHIYICMCVRMYRERCMYVCNVM